MKTYRRLATAGLLGCATFLGMAPSTSEANTAGVPLYEGPYATILGRYVKTDSADAIDNGKGVTIGFGLRREVLAFEGRASFTSFDTGRGLAGSGNILVFPFDSLPGLYGLFGLGIENIHGYPGLDGSTFNNANLDTGLGYIFPLSFGSYQFGLRAEVLYEYAKRNKREQDQPPPTVDVPAPSRLDNVILHVGLQLPFGSPAPAPVAPPPAEVVPMASEPLPPAPVAPPPPVCRTPLPGERVSLAGCGTGDVIVLRGVNFDFDKSSLTTNAKAILDNVADELKAYPNVQIELDGHTDSRGGDDYNQRLSERRAASVATYLAEHGIDAGRMTSKGFGETMPVADNDTDEGREQNRRTELKIVGSAATAPGAAPAQDAMAAPAAADAPSP